MRTPAGTECRHYYEDYNRGRNLRECRLIRSNPDSLRWQPSDCSGCPVPAILRANACKDMELKLTMKPALLGLRRKHVVTATCQRDGALIENPYTGCGSCSDSRKGLELFQKALEQTDND